MLHRHHQTSLHPITYSKYDLANWISFVYQSTAIFGAPKGNNGGRGFPNRLSDKKNMDFNWINNLVRPSIIYIYIDHHWINWIQSKIDHLRSQTWGLVGDTICVAQKSPDLHNCADLGLESWCFLRACLILPYPPSCSTGSENWLQRVSFLSQRAAVFNPDFLGENIQTAWKIKVDISGLYDIKIIDVHQGT